MESFRISDYYAAMSTDGNSLEISRALFSQLKC